MSALARTKRALDARRARDARFWRVESASCVRSSVVTRASGARVARIAAHRARMASAVEVARVGPKKQNTSLWFASLVASELAKH